MFLHIFLNKWNCRRVSTFTMTIKYNMHVKKAIKWKTTETTTETKMKMENYILFVPSTKKGYFCNWHQPESILLIGISAITLQEVNIATRRGLRSRILSIISEWSLKMANDSSILWIESCLYLVHFQHKKWHTMLIE